MGPGMFALRQHLLGDGPPIKTTRLNSQNIEVNGFTLDRESTGAFLMGWAFGMQFSTENFSECFYSSTAMVVNAQNFVADVEDLKAYGEYFNLIFYDPAHWLANSIALYE